MLHSFFSAVYAAGPTASRSSPATLCAERERSGDVWCAGHPETGAEERLAPLAPLTTSGRH